MIADFKNKETYICISLDQSSSHSTESMANDNSFAIMLMASQDDSPKMLPSLKDALKTNYLPIEFDKELRPTLPLPTKSCNIAAAREESIVDTDFQTLPPLSIPPFFQGNALSFENLSMVELEHHLKKENIPDTQGERALTLHREMFEHNMMKYTSIYKIIYEYVLPKWTQYLFLKNRRKDTCTVKRRADTYKKKIVRDLREFYRILFRRRFHLSEYKTLEGIKSCMKTLFTELGFNLNDEDVCDYHLFRYLHQTHKSTSQKNLEGFTLRGDSPFRSVEKYNDTRYNDFLTHTLGSQIFYFVFKNFRREYLPSVKSEVRPTIVKMINKILSYYDGKREISGLKHAKTSF
ncbi:unnamed protein product [Moneuplotes crassus]|uniref:Uncharacterized protein n=1 Tax=Euplotes crassus TaxID=5936 RepID=A0AAD1UH45_EUPCR|nr:unnamed protein product [Moneuplotes crassus]